MRTARRYGHADAPRLESQRTPRGQTSTSEVPGTDQSHGHDGYTCRHRPSAALSRHECGQCIWPKDEKDTVPPASRSCGRFQSLAAASFDWTTCALRTGDTCASSKRSSWKDHCNTGAWRSPSCLPAGRLTWCIKLLRPTGVLLEGQQRIPGVPGCWTSGGLGAIRGRCHFHDVWGAAAPRLCCRTRRSVRSENAAAYRFEASGPRLMISGTKAIALR
jgi:hypothetical protein